MSSKYYLGSWALPSGNSCEHMPDRGAPVLRLGRAGPRRPGPRPPEGQTGTTRQGAMRPSPTSRTAATSRYSIGEGDRPFLR